jgi:hypothetical protein
MYIQDIVILFIGLFFHMIGKNSISTGIYIAQIVVLVFKSMPTYEPFNKMKKNSIYYPVLSDPNVIEFKNSYLHGKQNPKTLIDPPIAPPLGDLDNWKAHEYTTHSHINARTVQDNSNLIDDPYITTNDWLSSAFPQTEYYNMQYNKYPQNDIDTYNAVEQANPTPSCKPRRLDIRYPKSTVEPFISELQPNIYTDNPPQPILSNLGLVDDTPQHYTVLASPFPGNPSEQIYVETSTEPHFTRGEGKYKTLEYAYGFPKKHHVKEQQLTPRQDLSQYYMKSKIDMFDYDQTAPLYKLNPDAVKTHIDVTNRSRSNMQETLMRKRNAEAWQQRMYPIDTNQRRMLGGSRIH